MRRSRLLPVALAAAALVTASAIVLSGSTNPDPGRRGPAGPTAAAGLSPTPREVATRTDGFTLPASVGVVRDPAVGAATVDALTGALRAAGATDIAVAASDPGRSVTVWLTGAEPVLGRLGVATADGLPAEGYVLATGRTGDRRHIAVDGVDPAGTFYAVQTLRQVLAAPGRGSVPGISIRDWPAIARRGVILGFYGTPWTLQETLDQIDYMAEHKMNSFVYTPKDDPYLRAQWRDPLPAGRLADLRAIVERATPLHIDVGWILSPGLSICFSAPEDQAAVLAKLDSVYALGVRTFGIALDDINYTSWHCPQDAATFATEGVAGAARAQVGLLNRVAAWAREKGDVGRVELVPTEYFDLADSPYKTVIREQLDPSVVVMFTGNGVIPRQITVDDVATVRQRFGHDILIWDNYPVTDYIPGRLAMGTYSGRQPGLSRQVTGILSNPEAHPAVNKISVYTVAAFTWHDEGYDPVASWRAALADRAGGDPATVEALTILADLSSFDGTLHPDPAPDLARALGEFWQRWRRGDRPGAVDLLRGRADAIVAAAERLRTAAVFDMQAAPWLDATWRWGRALRAAAEVLAAPDADGSEPAYARIDEEVAAAAALRGVRVPHAGVAPVIADWVLEAFLSYVRSGYVTEPPAAVVSLGTYQQNTPAAMVDGDLSTAYSSDAPVTVDDAVGVDLGEVRGIGVVLVQQGTPQHTGDYIRAGVVECSVDGVTWTQIGAGTGPLVRAVPPPGTQARYVRLRATADNDDHWVAVREFTVTAPR